jgi:hypothetical protein
VRRGALVFALALLAHAPSLYPGGPLATAPEPARLVPDEGTVVYDAARIAGGAVMYRDFFEFQGPVFYYATAGAHLLLGPSIEAGRALHLLTTALAALFLFLLVAEGAGTVAGAAAAAIHVCLLVPVWPYSYPHWLAEALLLGGLLAATRGRLLLAGALLGSSLATIQSVGLPALVAVAATLGLLRRSPLRLLAGAALALAPIAVAFALAGALPAMLHAMWIWPFAHYGGGQEDVAGYAAYLGTYLAAHAPVVWPLRALASFALVLVAGLPIAGALGAAVAWLRGLRRDAPPPHAAAGALAVVVPVLVLTRHDLTHLAFVGGAALVGGSWLWRARAGAIVLGLAALLVAASFAAKTVATWPTDRPSFREVVLSRLPNASVIDRAVPAAATIVVGNAGGFYYLYVRPAAVSHTYLPATAMTYLSHAQWATLAAEIAERRPALLQLGEAPWGELVRRRPALADRYTRPAPGVFMLREGAP